MISGSFTGLLAAEPTHEGKIDPGAPETKYVAELADSAWGDMKEHHDPAIIPTARRLGHPLIAIKPGSACAVGVYYLHSRSASFVR